MYSSLCLTLAFLVPEKIEKPSMHALVGVSVCHYKPFLKSHKDTLIIIDFSVSFYQNS